MNYTKEEINLIVLSYFNLPVKANRVLLSDLTSADPDFKSRENFLIKTLPHGVYNKVKDNFFSPEYREGVLSSLEKKEIQCVTYFSQGYPEALKNIDAPPVVLYCKGDVSLLKTQCFSIVGSRKTLPKELKLCEKISGELSRHFTIVSGIAEGADTKALEGALDSGGKVVSVLASGFDNIYPACNANLLKRVEKRGLTVSEYPPEITARPYYFRFRNRIIAGLSRGTLVVSAGERSGALITANYAADYGREVFTFPYSIGVASGAGCNALIKKGVCLAQNALDIFSEFGLVFKSSEKIPLSETECEVYKIIRNSEAAYLPAIADKLKKSVSEITIAVTSLTIKGLILSVGGNRYSAQS